MGENMHKQIEEFQRDYDKIFEKGKWEACDYTTMKDLQKLMYYIEVRDAMKNGGEYPGSEYMDQNSYARGNQMRSPSTGRFMSHGFSGTYPMNNGPWYYDDGRMSGRRYYDDGYMSGRNYYDGQKEDAIHKLHKVMDSENNPEFKMAVQEAIHTLEMK